jgi:hypothetical protein
MAEVSDFDSVSVYAFKDPARRVASFIVLDKRAQRGAKVNIALAAPIANSRSFPTSTAARTSRPSASFHRAKSAAIRSSSKRLRRPFCVST